MRKIKNDFWIQLNEITDAEREKVKEKVGEIRKLYKDAIQYLSSEKEEKDMDKGKAKTGQKTKAPESGRVEVADKEGISEFMELSLGDKGKVFLPKNDMEDSAKRLIELIKLRAGIEEDKKSS